MTMMPSLEAVPLWLLPGAWQVERALGSRRSSATRGRFAPRRHIIDDRLRRPAPADSSPAFNHAPCRGRIRSPLNDTLDARYSWHRFTAKVRQTAGSRQIRFCIVLCENRMACVVRLARWLRVREAGGATAVGAMEQHRQDFSVPSDATRMENYGRNRTIRCNAAAVIGAMWCPRGGIRRLSADAVLHETGGPGQVSVLMPLVFETAVTSDSRACLVSAGFS